MSGGDPIDETLDSGPAIVRTLFADRYRVLRPLGRGSSKEVYLVHDERLDRDVALALLPGGGAAERVRRELQVTGRLGEHPHVVTVHDAGEHDGSPTGPARARGRLARRARRSAPGAAAAGRRGRQAGRRDRRRARPRARAWRRAPRRQAGQRLARPRRPRRARRLRHRAAAGSPRPVRRARRGRHARAICRPSRRAASRRRPPSDLYGLGVTLYELVCGRPPFSAESAAALIAQHLHAVPAPPSALRARRRAARRAAAAPARQGPGRAPAAAAAVRDELAGAAAAAGAPRGLVGRERAMARAARRAATRRWRAALRVVALAGEAGIGKTRCAEAARRATPRARGCVGGLGSLRARTRARPPTGPGARALRGAGRATGGCCPRRRPAEDSPDEARFRAVGRRRGCLGRARGRRPLAIVLEDVHWADPLVAAACSAHLVRAAARAPLLVLLTHRPPRVAPGRARPARGGRVLRQPRARWARRGGGRGARRGGRRAGRDAGGAARRCASARAATRSTSPSSCARSAPARARTSRAACARSSPRRAAALPGDPRDARARRRRRHRILAARRGAGRGAGAGGGSSARSSPRCGTACSPRPAPPRYRFAHAVTREVLYEAQPAAPRAERHARLAQVLEARLEREPDQPLAEIAHHAVMAARGGLDAAPALRWSREAAREAARVLAYAEAALHLDRALEALELGELGTAADRLALLFEAAATNAEAGELDASQEPLRAGGGAGAPARRRRRVRRRPRSATRSSSTTASSTRRRSRCSRRPAAAAGGDSLRSRRCSAGSACGSTRRPTSRGARRCSTRRSRWPARSATARRSRACWRCRRW